MNFIETLFPGLAGLSNIHPLFVHFPIAFWTGALLLEGLAVTRDERLHSTAAWFLHLGTLAALVTVPTGFAAEYAAALADPRGHHGPTHQPIHIHRAWMLVTTGVGFCVSAYFFWVDRKSVWPFHRWGLLAATAVLAALVAMGADRGARLVYEFGTGVRPALLKTPAEADNADTGHGHSDEADSHSE